MTSKITPVTAIDGRNIEAHYWTSPAAKAYIHICHGMAEHINRYDELANFLHQQGFNIWYHQGSIGGDYRLDAHSLDGRLLKTYHWQAPNQSGSYQKNFQLDPGISEASLILSLYHNNTLVSSQQLIYQAGGRH